MDDVDREAQLEEVNRWPAMFWRWSCPCGAGGAANSSAESDAQASNHQDKCGRVPVRMHTGASPEPWRGQAKLPVASTGSDAP